MTTNIKVEAHCSNALVVRIEKINSQTGEVESVGFIENGVTRSISVYSPFYICVEEVVKDTIK